MPRGRLNAAFKLSIFRPSEEITKPNKALDGYKKTIRSLFQAQGSIKDVETYEMHEGLKNEINVANPAKLHRGPVTEARENASLQYFGAL